jgi:hypothetical protein
VCPIPDACLLVMAQRPSRLLDLPETRSLIFLIKKSPDQAEGYLDYLQPMHPAFRLKAPAPPTPQPRHEARALTAPPPPRRLTQKRFTITHPSGGDASNPQVNLSTITFHEFLSQQHSELETSSSGRVFYHDEDTEPSSPQGLQHHEPPD